MRYTRRPITLLMNRRGNSWMICIVNKRLAFQRKFERFEQVPRRRTSFNFRSTCHYVGRFFFYDKYLETELGVRAK